MTEEKQIGEMAVEFAKINCNPKGCYRCDLCDEYGSLELSCEDYLYYRNSMAETFYNAGYRKASELLEEIERVAISKIDANLSIATLDDTYYIEAIDELKKKYGSEKDDGQK